MLQEYGAVGEGEGKQGECYDQFSLQVGDRTENSSEVGKILTAAH